MASIEKRTSQNGEISYRVKVRLKGHPTQTATFARLTDARRWAQQIEAAILEGRHFKTSASKKHTLGEVIDRYLRDVLPNKSHSQAFLRGQRHQLQWWKQRIGDHVLADVTPALLVECRDALRAEPTARGRLLSAATVNRYLAALSHALGVAEREWGWIENNPLRKVSLLREPRGRVRFLDDDERERLLAACRKSESPHLFPVVVLALSTGTRKNEILHLRWPDIDLERGHIILHETKNGERRALPIRGKALELLRQHAKVRALHCDYVFPSPTASRPIDIRTPWETALRKAGVEDFRFHDLRHSAASYLAMNGASLAEIAEVLGHKTLQMVKRYAHLSEAHTASVVERMNRKIFGEAS